MAKKLKKNTIRYYGLSLGDNMINIGAGQMTWDNVALFTNVDFKKPSLFSGFQHKQTLPLNALYHGLAIFGDHAETGADDQEADIIGSMMKVGRIISVPQLSKGRNLDVVGLNEISDTSGFNTHQESDIGKPTWLDAKTDLAFHIDPATGERIDHYLENASEIKQGLRYLERFNQKALQEKSGFITRLFFDNRTLAARSGAVIDQLNEISHKTAII